MNNRGQALIEALLASALCVGGFFILMKCSLNFIYAAWTDEILEEHLLCRAAHSSECDARLQEQLALLKVTDYKLQTSKNETVYADQIEIKTPLLHIFKERELSCPELKKASSVFSSC